MRAIFKRARSFVGDSSRRSIRGSPTQRYRGFISYSHKDKSFVEPGAHPREAGFPLWLHRRLESYVIPGALRRECASEGVQLPSRLGRFFRDDDEFGSEENLNDAIEKAIARTDNLVILCSTRSAASAYVTDEVRLFKHRRGGASIFAVILEGKPNDPDRECFPKSLRYSVDDDGALTERPAEREPIAADLQEFDRETVFLKLVAGILGVEYGRLRNREKQAERQRRARASLIFAAGLLLMALAITGAYGVARLMSGLGQRASITLAQSADDASERGDFLAAARFARAGMAGSTWPLIGYDAQGAEAELRRAIQGPHRLARFVGDGSPITFITYSPNGTRLASMTVSGIGRLWDVASGRLIATLRTKQPLKSGAFSADGSIFAAQCRNTCTSPALWRAADGQALAPLRGDTDYVYSFVFVPKTTKLVTLSADRSMRLWDGATGAQIAVLARDIKPYGDLAISPDGAWLGLDWDGGLGIWDMNSLKMIGELKSKDSFAQTVRPEPAHTIALSQHLFAAGYVNGTIRIWATKALKQIASLSGHTTEIEKLVFGNSDLELASADFDGLAQIWDPLLATSDKLLRGHSAAVDTITLTADFKRVMTHAQDGTVRLWDAKDGRTEALFGDSVRFVSAGTMLEDGRRLALGMKTGDIEIWDIARLDDVQTLPGNYSVKNIIISNDDVFFAANDQHVVHVFGLAIGKELANFPGEDDKNESAMAFSPDSKRLAISTGKSIAVHDLRSPAGDFELTDAPDTISIAFSPDGTKIATANYHHGVTIWDVATRRKLHILTGFKGDASSIAFSPDGSLIATVADEPVIRLWDVATGSARRALAGHGDYHQVSFSGNGAELFAAPLLQMLFELQDGAKSDDALEIWDTSAGAKTWAMPGHFTWFGIARDGEILATQTGFQNAELRFWDRKSGRVAGVIWDTGEAVVSQDGRFVAYSDFESGPLHVAATPAALTIPTAELLRRACTITLQGDLSQFPPEDMRMASVLDPNLDGDACHPASLLRRFTSTLGL